MSKFNEDTLSMEPSDIRTDLGKQLRRAREASNLSIQSVANSLHLAPRIIIALEENDLHGSGPFVMRLKMEGVARRSG